MKKYILGFMLLAPFAANAQMTDTLGALGISGMTDADAYKNVARMQGALKQTNFKQELAELITETQIAALNNHFEKSDVSFSGLEGVDWDVASAAAGQYYIELKNLDSSDCNTVKYGSWGTHHVDINENGECSSGANTVKLYF